MKVPICPLKKFLEKKWGGHGSPPGGVGPEHKGKHKK